MVARRVAPSSTAAVLQAASAVGWFNARDWVSGIDMPVAVIATTKDHLVPVGQAKVAMSIPAAALHSVDSGHVQVGPLIPAPTVLEMRRACDEVAIRSARWTRMSREHSHTRMNGGCKENAELRVCL